MTTTAEHPEVDRVLVETFLRICADDTSRAEHDEAGTAWSETLWHALAESGLTRVGIAEAAGGSGGTADEAAELIRLSGYAGAPVPLAEALLLGGPLLAAARLPLPDGPLTVAPVPGELVAVRAADGWTISGRMTNVAWAQVAEQVVALAESAQGPVVVAIPFPATQVVAGVNLAGEPRDTVSVSGATVAGAHGVLTAENWRERGALARSLQMAGALERVLEMTVAYSKQREQFGRPIVRFQAVGQLIALLGEAVAQARMAAETAAGTASSTDIAIAKVIAGEAATTGTAHAHQVFGAIGMTRECDLQRFTRRLWSWRDEYGAERFWAERIGQQIQHDGVPGLWGVITENNRTETRRNDS